MSNIRGWGQHIWDSMLSKFSLLALQNSQVTSACSFKVQKNISLVSLHYLEGCTTNLCQFSNYLIWCYLKKLHGLWCDGVALKTWYGHLMLWQIPWYSKLIHYGLTLKVIRPAGLTDFQIFSYKNICRQSSQQGGWLQKWLDQMCFMKNNSFRITFLLVFANIVKNVLIIQRIILKSWRYATFNAKHIKMLCPPLLVISPICMSVF